MAGVTLIAEYDEGLRRMRAALLKLGAVPLDRSVPYYQIIITIDGKTTELNVLPLAERLARFFGDATD